MSTFCLNVYRNCEAYDEERTNRKQGSDVVNVGLVTYDFDRKTHYFGLPQTLLHDCWVMRGTKTVFKPIRDVLDSAPSNLPSRSFDAPYCTPSYSSPS